MGTKAVAAMTVGLLVILGAVITVRQQGNARSVEDRRVALRAVQAEGYWQDLEAWRSRIDGCRRGKLDRTAIARALRAQSTYLNLVLQAESVKQDVKTAAAANQRAQNASASSLESRTGSNLNCETVSAKPVPPPWLTPAPSPSH